MTVVVIGDANVDLEIRLPSGPAGLAHANPDPRLFGGGSAANTAAALAKLGVDCRFVGTVGDDSFGRFAVEALSAVSVDVSSVGVSRDEATVAVVVVVAPDGERLIYVWPPTGGAHTKLEVDVATAAVAGADWLHVSGICLRMAPAREAVLEAMDAARGAGIPVSLDLNLRLENWGWQDGFRAAIEEAIERANVVLGGAADEVGPMANETDPTAAALRLAGTGRVVVARTGADGAIVAEAGRASAIPAFEVEVADTVGAGDAFNAGFICSRVSGGTVREAIYWGNAVAAFTVSRAGARSHPTQAELDQLLLRRTSDG